MSATGSMAGNCPFCKDSVSDGAGAKLTQKGVDGIHAASSARGESLVVTVGTVVHKRCREEYVHKRNILRSQAGAAVEARRSRRLTTTFTSKTDCLFCGQTVNLRSSKYSKVRTLGFEETIKQCCDRRSDDWAMTVRGRIESVGDLPSADCIYHQLCDVSFRQGGGIPSRFQDAESDPPKKLRKGGRPADTDQQQAFLRLCAHLQENKEEQFSIPEIEQKMREFLADKNASPYSRNYLKSKLMEHFGDTILIVGGEGLSDIVTFTEKTSSILLSFYRDSKADSNEEAKKRAIIDTAARLIKSEIHGSVASTTDHYPKLEDLTLESALNFVPESLRSLLIKIFPKRVPDQKVASIGQAIVQASRPRGVMSPLQIGLAVQMHHRYRSSNLLGILSGMGFCSSYFEVLRFQRNAASCFSPDSLLGGVQSVKPSWLFAADNVDHNSVTLDGRGTFHGMGMIATLTPGVRRTTVVPRKKISELHVSDTFRVEITDYRFAKRTAPDVNFMDISCYKDSTTAAATIDILWELSARFEQPAPNWQGMMHAIYKSSTHTGTSSIMYLPMIDMSPTDRTCIASTLEFISKVAKKHDVPAIITFDQPLYWKASEIIKAEPPDSDLRKIVLMLGSFHTFMNFLGAIGTLMGGTGLKSILEVVYSENAVVHMLTGKAVSRAFRGHLLVDKCLHHLLLQSIEQVVPDFTTLMKETENMYSSLKQNETNPDSVVTSAAVTRLCAELEKKRTELSAQSKTSKLWLGYQQMVSTARDMIKADRSASWVGHLNAVYAALPVFAAAGHYNYLKSVHLHLQEMIELENKNPEVYRMFQDGLHVVRRTDQFWAGLGCDLVIEQTLMRSLKTSGGLTHGSKMTEDQRAVWTMSSPVMAEFSDAMQDFNDITQHRSEQHRDCSSFRMERDTLDMGKILCKLSLCSPFSDDSSLRNIVTGVLAGEDVNVHEYASVGRQVMQGLLGKNVFTFKFKTSDKARTLSKSSAVSVSKDRTIDPGLLFQRFLVVSKAEEVDLRDMMRYELCAYPTALFENNSVLRKADKPQLAHAIADHCKTESSTASPGTALPDTDRFVVDGGYLLRKLTWTRGKTFRQIAQSYATLTCRNYWPATVVFDGYESGPSIKDNTHRRRRKGVSHPVVHFTPDTVFEGKQEEFLSVGENKQQLIQLIVEELRTRGCVVSQSPGDANVDISNAAIRSARKHSTTLIGEDTDLLILLLQHADVDGYELHLRSDTQSRVPTVYSIIELKRTLGSVLCGQLLFIHALTGCDSTSRIFGVGKRTAFQKLVKGNTVLAECATAFTAQGTSADDIQRMGIKAVAVLCGDSGESSLEDLRFRTLSRKVAAARSFVNPEQLPPTASATKYHCLRVYFQTMIWMDMGREMDPVHWGWKLQGGELVPVMCDMKPAPDSLLSIVRCNCQTGCERCSCRSYGLPCSSACGECQVTRCENQVLVDIEGSDEEES